MDKRNDRNLSANSFADFIYIFRDDQIFNEKTVQIKYFELVLISWKHIYVNHWYLNLILTKV